jgi:ATP-dependent helicase/DNAse subunit B
MPAHFERPLRVENVIEGYAFQGRLDRVDVDEKGRRLRVVDYKTHFPRSQTSLENRVFKGQVHQPLFYLELAQKDPRLGLTDFAAESASFYAIENPAEEKSSQHFSGEQWRRARTDLLRRVESLLRGIENGYFLIRPEEGMGGSCYYCPFDAACRKSHGPTRWRAENSEWRAQEDESRRQLSALKSAGKETVS